MNVSTLREALEVFDRYEPNGTVSIEHDEVFIGSDEPDAMDEADVDDLEDLGFSWDYSIESWRAFT